MLLFILLLCLLCVLNGALCLRFVFVRIDVTSVIRVPMTCRVFVIMRLVVAIIVYMRFLIY